MSLAAMIAAQKAAQEKKANESKPAAESVGGTVATESAPAAPAAPKLKFGLKKTGTTPAKGESDVGQVPAASQSVATPDSGAPAVDISGGVFSLDDLENVTAEGIESSGKEPERGMYAFADEIPSTAPTRELPEELTDGMKAFVDSLNSIYEIVHDPELFGQMIRTIMQEMQENPDYTKLVADQDVHTMLRGLRQNMGLAKIKKAEKATKTRGSPKAPKTTALAGTADAMFNDDQW